MVPGNNWIRRSTECARAWRQPRWRLQLLATPKSWVHAALASSAVTQAVTPASAPLPAGHGT